MFNTGRFNLQRFNILTRQEEDIPLESSMHVNVQCLLTNGQNIFEVTFASALVNSKTYVAAGVFFAAEWQAAVSRRSVLSVNLIARETISEAVQGTQNLVITFHPSYAMKGTVGAWSHLSSDFYTSAAMSGDVQGDSGLSMDYRAFEALLDAVWWAQVATKRFDIQYIDIDIPIPPGATLIIDSDNYVVLLNGEDVIRAHGGSWLQLNREIYDVVFRSTGGQMIIDKQILYQEKWL